MKGILLILGLLPILSSCAFFYGRSIHDATPLNLPLHQEKGELKLTGEIGYMSGLTGSGSYALTDHFAVMTSTSKNKNQFISADIISPIYLKMNSSYTEGAIGYYSCKDSESPFIMEGFLGYGAGVLDKRKSANNRFDFNYTRLSGNFARYFVQGNFGLKISKHFEIGVGNRLSLVHHSDLKYANFINNPYYERTYDLGAQNTYLYEKVTYCAIGLDNLKITTQVGGTLGLNKPPRNEDVKWLDNGSIIATAGLQLKLRTQKNSKK